MPEPDESTLVGDIEQGNAAGCDKISFEKTSGAAKKNNWWKNVRYWISIVCAIAEPCVPVFVFTFLLWLVSKLLEHNITGNNN